MLPRAAVAVFKARMEQPGAGEGVPAHGMSLKVPSSPNHSVADLILQVQPDRAATTAQPGLRELCQDEFSVKAFPGRR